MGGNLLRTRVYSSESRVFFLRDLCFFLLKIDVIAFEESVIERCCGRDIRLTPPHSLLAVEHGDVSPALRRGDDEIG